MASVNVASKVWLQPAEVPTLQDSDSSADSGSETDDSVDTQSETEVVALPFRGGGRLRTGLWPGPSAQTGILRKWRVCQTVLQKWRYQSAHPFFSF